MSAQGKAPAFPVQITNRGREPLHMLDGDSDAMAAPIEPGETINFTGLDERTYIAARAMQALCSGGKWPDSHDATEIARRSVLMADALIAALNAKPPG